MLPGQYALDRYVFGAGTTVGVADLDRGPRTLTVQDAPVPGGDGLAMGRDTETGPEWTFTLRIRETDEAAALAALAGLRTAWEGPRDTPGAVSALTLVAGGRARQVFGRPRRFQEFADPVHLAVGWVNVLASFQLADALYYDDDPSVLDLGLIEHSDGVLVLPEELPWYLGRARGRRQGEITVGGNAPVPFEVTFHGPVSGTVTGLWAQGTGWRIDLGDLVLAWDQTVTVDTRTHTITRHDGLALPGAARGRFLAARLAPGAQEIAWGAVDPTSTARMTLTWRNGHRTL